MRLDPPGDKLGYTLIGVSAIVSALGWFSIDRWVDVTGEGSAVLTALLRTTCTLLPAIVGFWMAMRRQRATHHAVALRLNDLRAKVAEYQRVRRIEHELHTMDRMAKVAREAVKNTASSAKELLGAIEAVDDPHVKERLVERYRNHTNNVVTVLAAVNEQMEQSGRGIQSELTAEDAIHVLEREKVNTAKGIEHAREIMEQRGIVDGVDQLKFAAEQAKLLQSEMIKLRIGAPAARLGGPPAQRNDPALPSGDPAQENADD